MSQNRSTAVMQRRRVAPDALDYFPTPPWATRALCEFLIGIGQVLRDKTVREPACGEMHMARPLGEYFPIVLPSDVHPYGKHPIVDFPLEAYALDWTDWTISNPPFSLAEEFIRAALMRSRIGVAMLLRSAILEGGARHQNLYGPTPPSYVLQFTERVVMLEGRLVRAGAIDPFSDKPGGKATTATAYVWLIWLAGDRQPADTRMRWTGECRLRLERPGDYPDYPSEAAPGGGEGLFAQSCDDRGEAA